MSCPGCHAAHPSWCSCNAPDGDWYRCGAIGPNGEMPTDLTIFGCSGYGLLLGTLGRRSHWRCRDCGMEWSTRSIEDDCDDETA